MTNAYADCRASLRASLHFVDPDWLDVAFTVATRQVPEDDLESYPAVYEHAVIHVLNQLHAMPDISRQ